MPFAKSRTTLRRLTESELDRKELAPHTIAYVSLGPENLGSIYNELNENEKLLFPQGTIIVVDEEDRNDHEGIKLYKYSKSIMTLGGKEVKIVGMSRSGNEIDILDVIPAEKDWPSQGGNSKTKKTRKTKKSRKAKKTRKH